MQMRGRRWSGKWATVGRQVGVWDFLAWGLGSSGFEGLKNDHFRFWRELWGLPERIFEGLRVVSEWGLGSIMCEGLKIRHFRFEGFPMLLRRFPEDFPRGSRRCSEDFPRGPRRCSEGFPTISRGVPNDVPKISRGVPEDVPRGSRRLSEDAALIRDLPGRLLCDWLSAGALIWVTSGLGALIRVQGRLFESLPVPSCDVMRRHTPLLGSFGFPAI